MLQTARSIYQIRSSSGVNWFMYYLKRLPLAKKLVKDSVYEDMELKRILSVMVSVVKTIWRFLTKLMYVGLFIYLPARLVGGTETERLGLFWYIFVILSFLTVFLTSAKVLEPKRDKYICVKLMGLSADRYMKATLLQYLITFFLTFLPAVVLFSSLLGAPISQGVLFTILLTGWRLVVEVVNLVAFDRAGLIIVKNNALIWLGILGGNALAYLSLLKPAWAEWSDKVVFSLPAVVLITLLGAGAALYLAYYPRYRDAVAAVNKSDEPLLNLGKMMADSKSADVKTREQDFTEAELTSGKFESKTGYDYLNALFFERHRRLMVQPVKLRLAIVGVCFAAGLVFLQLAAEKSAEFAQLLIGALPAFIFVMHMLSIGERVCKAMFYNCDNSLLRYGYYREKQVLLKNFRVRLLRIILLNLIPAAVICVALVILVRMSGIEWPIPDMAFYLLAILGLSVFFSVHHLFMYYIFQPYTTEVGMKNPFYFIINSVVLFLCIIALQIQRAPAGFALIVLGATVLYTALALTLVYRLSPRTFRVK